MIRLRVSTVEDYRRVVTTDYASESDLIDRIRRGQWAGGPSNWQMDAGTAWHAVLADPIGTSQIKFDKEGTPYKDHHCGGYLFDAWAVGAALKHQGDGLREVTGRKPFTPAGREVQVEGTCDHIRGLFLRDSKAKFSKLDAGDYEPSLQWRFYLSIFGAECFTYDLFDFADPKDGYCRLKDIISFRFWAYPGMESDCRDWLGRFLSWAESRRLLPLLERPQARIAA